MLSNISKSAFFNLELHLGKGSAIYEIDGTKCVLSSGDLFSFQCEISVFAVIGPAKMLINPVFSSVLIS